MADEKKVLQDEKQAVQSEKNTAQNEKQSEKSVKKSAQKKRNSAEAKIERAFCLAVKNAGGVALKFTSQTMNGVPDRLILFKIGKCAFVELKAPGKQMRPLQRKRRLQLEELGFPVFCVDNVDQIQPVIKALQAWNPGEPLPKGVGAVIPEIKEMELPEIKQELIDTNEELPATVEEVMPL